MKPAFLNCRKAVVLRDLLLFSHRFDSRCCIVRSIGYFFCGFSGSRYGFFNSGSGFFSSGSHGVGSSSFFFNSRRGGIGSSSLFSSWSGDFCRGCSFRFGCRILALVTGGDG